MKHLGRNFQPLVVVLILKCPIKFFVFPMLKSTHYGIRALLIRSNLKKSIKDRSRAQLMTSKFQDNLNHKIFQILVIKTYKQQTFFKLNLTHQAILFIVTRQQVLFILLFSSMCYHYCSCCCCCCFLHVLLKSFVLISFLFDMFWFVLFVDSIDTLYKTEC